MKGYILERSILQNVTRRRGWVSLDWASWMHCLLFERRHRENLVFKLFESWKNTSLHRQEVHQRSCNTIGGPSTKPFNFVTTITPLQIETREYNRRTFCSIQVHGLTRRKTAPPNFERTSWVAKSQIQAYFRSINTQMTKHVRYAMSLNNTWAVSR